MTKVEAKAIADLQALAKRWPKSLMLVHHGDSPGISVKHASEDSDNIDRLPTLAQIKIRTEACA